jgi:divalent metal cation (Fe/Co/Zn/Cd) transporter
LGALGSLLFVEALVKLLSVERTTIGGITLFGSTIWAGWPMLGALVYSAVPSVLLGRAKLKLASQIHDKILYADAQMMKPDWMAESATVVGVLGVGFGLWWLDPVAATVVSTVIIKDGAGNVVVAVRDLMGHRPMKTDRSGPDELPGKLRACMESFDWVDSASVRLRETGHIFAGEVYLRPAPGCTMSRSHCRTRRRVAYVLHHEAPK